MSRGTAYENDVAIMVEAELKRRDFWGQGHNTLISGMLEMLANPCR